MSQATGPDPDFLPTFEQVWSRAEARRWLTFMRWDEAIIHSIMIDDHPNIEAVRYLVYRHGAERAYQKIRRFML